MRKNFRRDVKRRYKQGKKEVVLLTTRGLEKRQNIALKEKPFSHFQKERGTSLRFCILYERPQGMTKFGLNRFNLRQSCTQIPGLKGGGW